MSAAHLAKALALSQKIDTCAAELARNVRLGVHLACGGKPEFMAIMLEAVEGKIMAMRQEQQRKAAGR